MTVEDMLYTATQRGNAIKVGRQGSGAMSFLSSIDGIVNEGVGGRNWVYSVNGKTADRSFAVYELSAGDRVLWQFAAPR